MNTKFLERTIQKRKKREGNFTIFSLNILFLSSLPSSTSFIFLSSLFLPLPILSSLLLCKLSLPFSSFLYFHFYPSLLFYTSTFILLFSSSSLSFLSYSSLLHYKSSLLSSHSFFFSSHFLYSIFFTLTFFAIFFYIIAF